MKPVSPKDPKDARLAAALRENLKRRKAQARAQNQAREDVPKPPENKEKPGG